MRFLAMVMSWAINFLILGAIFYGVWYWGKTVGTAEGHSTALKTALKTNPPSEELEMVCAGLWFGNQAKKYYWKENKK